ncbi:MAG: Rieske 2Fe-2S domain-containing protein [Chloroherpetonaceae bacterium]|nr:Rieske 2Fe-2S domain-containing protein [Chloroherpetonaceae bacterium]
MLQNQSKNTENSLSKVGLDSGRRDFLKTAATSAVALCSLQFAAMLSSCGDSTSANDVSTGVTETLDLTANTALNTVGGFIRRTFGNNNSGREVIVMRLSETSFGAMDVLCPHQGCNVGNPSEGKAVCPCHDSNFGTSASNFGTRLSGPAPRGLRTFATSVQGNTLTITF